MPKKSKPKQRTNWKQRALHCEEVIGTLNSLSATTLARAQKAESALDESGKQVNALRFRAESAEKHNALLLEERDELKNYNVNSERERKHWYELYVNGKRNCDYVHNKLLSPPTHWQRFKSWLSGWYVELLCLIVILCVTAGCVAYVYWPRG